MFLFDTTLNIKKINLFKIVLLFDLKHFKLKCFKYNFYNKLTIFLTNRP